MNDEKNPRYVSTRNACKLCSPLGACFAMRGIEGCIPLIHGSQGCATYIRRYGISHFREPIDIASSNFVEATAIFGGRDNLCTALDNVTRQYAPAAIGVTSTCLSETIGENVPMYLNAYLRERGEGKRGVAGQAPAVFYASTPSYRGTHMDGYHEAIVSAVKALADPELKRGGERINLVSGFVSAEDLRELHRLLALYGREYTLLPDYSETLDGGTWEDYRKLPAGGTPIEAIRRMGEAAGTVYLGKAVPEDNAGSYLETACGVPAVFADLPIGIEKTDEFFRILTELTGRPLPASCESERNRLIDAYIDGHKYCSGKRAILYGDEDFVAAMASFLDEIGVTPVLVATGAANGRFAARVGENLKNCKTPVAVRDDTDFASVLEMAGAEKADFVIGNSKGYYLARNLGIPMVRCGFPIHDRIGGHRILHLGYRGAMNLFERICNALMEADQNAAPSGWTYI